MIENSVQDLDNDIDNLDKKIAVLQELRKKKVAEKQKYLPNALEEIMTSSKKRNRKILEDSDFQKLGAIMPNKPPQPTTSTMVIASLDEHDQAILKKAKTASKRETYSEDVKKIVVSLTKKYSRKEVSEATKISVNNVKKWKREHKTAKIPGKRGRRVTYPELEAELKLWIRSERQNNNHVSIRRLVREAKTRAAKQNKKDVKFTWGWVRSFLKRNSFHLRKPSTKINQPDRSQEVRDTFITKIKTKIESGLYDLDHIINMDETGVCFEEIKSKTICVQDEKSKQEDPQNYKHPATKSVGQIKDNLTVALAVSYTGIKLPAFIIFPDKGIKKLKINVPENIRKYHRPEGSYMDRKAMGEWINKVINPYSRKLAPNKKGLLLLDNFSGHLSPELQQAIEKFNYEVETLPPNSTKHLQPLDISVNRAFKAHISHKWEDFAASLTDKDITKTGNYIGLSRETKLKWVSWAWEQVHRDVVVNGWNAFSIEESENNNNVASDLSVQDNAHNDENLLDKSSDDLENLSHEPMQEEGYSNEKNNERDSSDNENQGEALNEEADSGDLEFSPEFYDYEILHDE